MAFIEGWLPPSRENWELVNFVFQFFPLFSSLQWVISWYGMGKTSTKSILNVPGKLAWFTMEVPSIIVLLSILFTLPAQLGIEELPFENRLMAGLFVLHYTYRSILYPLAAPSISPIHFLVWISAFTFQVLNALCIGGWLAGYGPTTRAEWSGNGGDFKASARMETGLIIFALGLVLVIFHDDELREIRRTVIRRRRLIASKASAPSDPKSFPSSLPSNPEAKTSPDTKSNTDLDSKTKPSPTQPLDEKIYLIPKNGFFKWILYPHYLFEWIEWSGFWLVGGPSFTPGRTFLINEISTMLPRAVQGKKWYEERFGKEKLEGRGALIPGLI